MRFRPTCVGLTALTLAGCGASSPVNRPDHSTIKIDYSAPVMRPAPHVGELTEVEVIKLAKQQDPEALAARQSAAVQRARLEGVGLYPNPSLSWNREQFVGSASESEDFLFLTVPIDLSTRRQTRRNLAHVNATVLEAKAALKQSDVVVRALGLLYELAAQEERIRIQEHASTRLDEAVRVVRRRKAEGTTAGYDQARIEIEAELATSRLAQSKSRALVLRGQLALLLNVEETDSKVHVDLKPKVELADGVSLELSSRSLELLRMATTESRSTADAGSRVWIPTVSITGGLRVGRSEATRYGYVGGLSLGLPIFSRGQGLSAQAAATERLAKTRVLSAEREAHLRFERARRTLSAARSELTRFTSATESRIEKLEKAAEGSYREGERSIIELLDARRARTAVEMRALELKLLIKQAEVELRAAQGEFQ